MKLYAVTFENRKPDVMAEFTYIVAANSRSEVGALLTNIDGEMHINEATKIVELDMLSPNVAYAPRINGLPLK